MIRKIRRAYSAPDAVGKRSEFCNNTLAVALANVQKIVVYTGQWKGRYVDERGVVVQGPRIGPELVLSYVANQTSKRAWASLSDSEMGAGQLQEVIDRLLIPSKSTLIIAKRGICRSLRSLYASRSSISIEAPRNGGDGPASQLRRLWAVTQLIIPRTYSMRPSDNFPTRLSGDRFADGPLLQEWNHALADCGHLFFDAEEIQAGLSEVEMLAKRVSRLRDELKVARILADETSKTPQVQTDDVRNEKAQPKGWAFSLNLVG